MKCKNSLFPLIFFTSLVTRNCWGFLNDKELSVLFELMNELEIRQCILVSDELFNIIDDVKRLSSIHVAVAYMNCDMFSGYIADDERKYYRNIGVVFKQKDLDRIKVIILCPVSLLGYEFSFTIDLLIDFRERFFSSFFLACVFEGSKTC